MPDPSITLRPSQLVAFQRIQSDVPFDLEFVLHSGSWLLHTVELRTETSNKHKQQKMRAMGGLTHHVCEAGSVAYTEIHPLFLVITSITIAATRGITVSFLHLVSLISPSVLNPWWPIIHIFTYLLTTYMQYSRPHCLLLLIVEVSWSCV